MKTLLATTIILAAALWQGVAQAGRWDFREQGAFGERHDRLPIFQRHQPAAPVAPGPARAPAPPSAPPPAQAAPAPHPETSNAVSPAAPPPPMQPADAARRAQQQYGGRVLSVSPGTGGYRVKMLKQGEVSVVTVPN